jgi:tetratricopeptide (TPR) repeat protein
MSRIEELEKRLAADPNSRMFVQLAEEYRKAGMLEQAIDCCEKGLKKHPQYPSARVALGRALLEAGSFDRASEEFEAVLKQVPDNILAHKFLGETYHRLGRFDEALKKYKVASTLAPEDTELGVRIQEVQAVLSGGPRPAAPAPSPAAPPAVTNVAPAPPLPPIPQAAPASMPVTPKPPFPSVDEMEETIIAPPESARPGLIDLPPIPLVEVDEPMVLETRDYIPPPKTAAPAAPAPPKPSPPSPLPAAFEDMEAENLYEPTIQEPFVFPPPVEVAAPSPPEPPPPPAPVAPIAPQPPPRPVPEIETATMAEIYASQGHIDQALAVYRKLVERNPAETRYGDRIEELLMLSRAAGENREPAGAAASSRNPADGSDADERTIQVLEDWLEAIRRSRGT